MELKPEIKSYIDKLPPELQPIILEAATTMAGWGAAELTRFLSELASLYMAGDIVGAEVALYQELGMSERLARRKERLDTLDAINMENAEKMDGQRAYANKLILSLLTVGLNIAMGFFAV
jgi:hypothetical protein